MEAFTVGIIQVSGFERWGVCTVQEDKFSSTREYKMRTSRKAATRRPFNMQEFTELLFDKFDINVKNYKIRILVLKGILEIQWVPSYFTDEKRTEC